MSISENTKKIIDFDTISYLIRKLRDENQSTYLNSSNFASSADIESIFESPKNYLTIEALEDGLTASLSMNACEYCIDEDGDWKTLSAGTPTESINTGQTLSFRGNLTPNSDNGIGTFTVSKKCNVSGNIMSMLFGDNGKDSLSLTDKPYAFYRLFHNCSNIISAKDLYLPATTLADHCYQYMFEGCTSLTTAPELPATELADYCYIGMFYGCTSLTTAPELPATTLTISCYVAMFRGCTSLTTAPELPATTLATYCYNSMFNGCTSLVNAPELPATNLADECYRAMFYNCTSLVNAPELPATTLTEYCYNSMFEGCTSLSYIKMLATDISISATDCLYNWVKNVASTGTFVKHPDMTSLSTGTSGIPRGWTVDNDNISPCIINQASESITFIYSDGLFTPTNKIIDLSQYFTKEELLSIQPECEIIVTLQDKTDNVLASEYVWTNDKTLGDVLNELDVTKDVYDINVIITKVNTPEDNGYYYYYTLDETEPFVEKDWMRIVSLEDDNTISLIEDIQYSVNGADWRNLNAYNTITVNSDDIVYFKGNNTNNQFTVNKAFNVEGNLMSLLYGDNFEEQIDLSDKDYAFNYLFSNCTTLKNAENLILPATTLANYCYSGMFSHCYALTTAPALPATTLASYCYENMFSNCTSLSTAPVLPATDLANKCYYGMFSGCTSLTTAPELPATTLEYYCYYQMFYGCTSLTTAPELPATTLAQSCYAGMFSGCTSLTTAPELPATTLEYYCYYQMFYGCTSLTTAPELPATTLAGYCYRDMFRNCTSLVTAPELPATTLVQQCYSGMFEGCTSLNHIKMLATDISEYDCLNNWVNDVASIGTFIKHPDMTSLPSGIDGIPYGWTVQDAAQDV